MTFAQVRVSYTSSKLTKLNWTNCLFFVLRRRNHQKSKYINMIKSIQILSYKMDTLFINL